MPTLGQTVYVLHGLSTWRKAQVVGTPERHGELIVRCGNLLCRPQPGCWRIETIELEGKQP